LRLLRRALLLLMLLRLGVLPWLCHRESAQTADDENAGNAGSDHAATKSLKWFGFLVHSVLRTNSLADPADATLRCPKPHLSFLAYVFLSLTLTSRNITVS
jgi:hypothetical protein